MNTIKKLGLICFLCTNLCAAGQNASFVEGDPDSQKIKIRESKEITGFNDYVYQFSQSPFGKFYACTSGDNKIELRDEYMNVIWEHQGDPRSVGGNFVFSPDERFLIFSKFRMESDIAILDLSTLEIVQVLSEHAYYVNDLAIHPNGKMLASVSSDKTLKIWTYGEEGFQLEPQLEKTYEKNVDQVEINAAGNMMALGTTGGIIEVFDIGEVKQGQRFLKSNGVIQQKGYSIEGLAFHPKDPYFVTSTSAGFKIWEIKKNKIVKSDSVAVKSARFQRLSFSPDGKLLAVGRSNGTIGVYFWKKSTLEEFVTIRRHKDVTFNVSFSQNGKELISASRDRTAVVWEVTGIKGNPRSRLINMLGANLSNYQRKIMTHDFSASLSTEMDQTLLREKGEFETTAQFEQRAEQAEKVIMQKLFQESVKHVCTLVPSGAYDCSTISLLAYNADREVYKVNVFDQDIGVNIPLHEARTLKENQQNVKVRVKGNLKDDADTWQFHIVHPLNKKTYPIRLPDNPFYPIHDKREISRDLSAPGSLAPIAPMPVNKPQSEAQAVPKTYALLFGTNEYTEFENLINPIIDAKAIQTELQDNFDVQVELCENYTQDAFIKKIRSYAKMKFGPKDQLFIFIAGHGKFDEIFGEGYLVTSDSEKKDYAKTSYLSHARLKLIIDHIKCNHIVLVMDVCFGGSFDIDKVQHRGTDMYDDVDKSTFIERKLKYKTRLYLTSGAIQYVPDGRPGHHSPFARRVLEALRSYGGEDGILTFRELIQSVEKVVPQPMYGEFGDNEPGSDFILISKDAFKKQQQQE